MVECTALEMRHTGNRIGGSKSLPLRQDNKFMAKTGILGGTSPKQSPIALKTSGSRVSSMGRGMDPTGCLRNSILTRRRVAHGREQAGPHFCKYL